MRPVTAGVASAMSGRHGRDPAAVHVAAMGCLVGVLSRGETLTVLMAAHGTAYAAVDRRGLQTRLAHRLGDEAAGQAADIESSPAAKH